MLRGNEPSSAACYLSRAAAAVASALDLFKLASRLPSLERDLLFSLLVLPFACGLSASGGRVSSSDTTEDSSPGVSDHLRVLISRKQKLRLINNSEFIRN